ncbi:kinesin [Durotheca rogersii]|uniref:kinesin n=1 Tax=Durotheca rogersii TaxID=419775 RepID=UPI00221FC569|nr:kinesin [Durotheca rogersii]KAI5862515.1 kinesin [Durotheca rogersii]
MEPQKAHANLFQVYLRLRPPPAGNASGERFLLVEDPADDESPTHITLNPPNDRRRAIEKFAFTRVFEEDATQLDLFQGTRVLPLVEGVLAPHGGDGTDGLLATLGVTGSGKSHTILGSRSQRGLTQLALDVVFRSIESNIVDCDTTPTLEASIRTSDASEATILSASAFLDTVYGDALITSRAGSRAPTPLTVRPSTPNVPPQLPGQFPASPGSVRLVRHQDDLLNIAQLSTPPSQREGVLAPSSAQVTPGRPKLAYRSPNKHYMALTSAARYKNVTKSPIKSDYPSPTSGRRLQRPSAFPQAPDISSIRASCDPSAEYAIVISMYEVYNDRIFDLLTSPLKSNATKEYRRRPLLFKSTELSPDRKVVAGLRKVICGSFRDALMVLEAGLLERRVAGTGSNSVSSRSHGFFCVEVKKRRRGRAHGRWGTSTLSVVDLAGSERARDAKTHGATLAEAGKINESLMYLGQCLQMQSDASSMAKPNLVPFRQCKLTELLFSNSFPSSASLSQSASSRRAPQKAVMIVTADPLGDFNATSQILRYSALAREVTVPRVPSITSTILATAAAAAAVAAVSARPGSGAGSQRGDQSEPSEGSRSATSSPVTYRHHQQQHRRPRRYEVPPSPPPPPPRRRREREHERPWRTFSPASDTERATMENAALEIARMAEAIEQLQAELERERAARVAAEAHLESAEERAAELEQEVREECYADFEARLAAEMGRWKASRSQEQEWGEAHWDRKVEVLARGVGAVVVTAPSQDGSGSDGDDDKENVLIENLEQENERLRREMAVLKRELANRTPSKRAPLQERGDVPSVRSEMAGLGSRLDQLRLSSHGSLADDEGQRKAPGTGGGIKKKVLKVSSAGSPTKKVRKLPAKKWDDATATAALADDDDLT